MQTYIEQDCTITHNGHNYTSGGAVVTPAYAVGYLKFDGPEWLGSTGTLTNWHGERLATARIVAKWPTPRSFMSSHMLQVECCIDGVWFTGRSAGSGMIWRGKPCAKQ